MKKLLPLALSLILLLSLTACDQQALPITQPEAPEDEEYIWTITIDDEYHEVLDETLGAFYLFTLKLSMSKEGGSDPFGVYRGEIDYTQNIDIGLLAQLMESADGDIWGKSDAFEIELAPFDQAQMDAFRASLAGEEKEPADTEEPKAETESSLPPLAPLVQTHAMCFGEDIPFTEKDFSIDVSFGKEFDIHTEGDTLHASTDLHEFGSVSDSGELTLPYSITLGSNTGSDEMYAIFTIYFERPFVFRGTIDKVPLSDTIAVGN